MSSQKIRTFVRRNAKVLLILLVVLVGVRAALPYALKRYINHVLQHDLEGYTGSVADVDLSLWRGAYQLEGLKILRVENTVPVPFLDFGFADLRIAWKPLFKGRFVGEIELDRSRMNFVSGRNAGESQTGAEGHGFRDAFDKIFPMKVNRFVIHHSEIHYMDFHSKPNVDVVLHDLDLNATNLSNVEKPVRDELVSKVALTAGIQQTGKLKLDATTDLMREPLAADLNLSLTEFDLTKLNDFLMAYGRFNVHHGQLDVYVEGVTKDNYVKGYVKPLLTHVDVVEGLGEIFKAGDRAIPETLASTVNLLIRRYSKDQLATKIPVEGRLDDPKVKVWSAIGGLFRHAFGTPQRPGIDHAISTNTLPRQKKSSPPGGTHHEHF